jgi:hypothetical protein
MKKHAFPDFCVFASLALLAACGRGDSEAAEDSDQDEATALADPCPARVQDRRGSEEPLSCSCDAETAATGTVWGSGPYSDDSAVCRAALHAGLVGDEPANVTITFLPGRNSYSASEANGVMTNDWGSWGGSFAFEGAALGEPAESALAACPSNARNLRGTGDTVECSCTAAAASGGSVWGTDVYTDDSSLCRAALHAGVIGRDGGDVTFTVAGGRPSYAGSTQNAVESRNYGSWEGSFEFADPNE